MISTDKKIFEENSGVRQRMAEYGTLCEELHIIVFARRIKNQELRIKISNNVFIYSTDSLSRLLYIFDAYKIAKRIFQNTKYKIQNTLVTCQDPFETGLAGWKIASALGARLQLQVHTDFMSSYFARHSLLNRARVLLAKFLLPKADCVRVVSERIKKSIARITKAPITVLPIWTDIKKFQNADGERIRARFPQFEKIVLVVSRLEPEKNVAQAIDIFAKTVKKYPKAGLLIVGDGSERSRLSLLVEKYGVSGNVIFLGVENDVAQYYAAADLYLNTSLYEGYGLSLMEAYAAGLHIVTTNVGIVGDIVSGDGVLLCQVGDTGCLLSSLSSILLNSRRLIRALAQTSKEEYLLAYKKQWELCAYK